MDFTVAAFIGLAIVLVIYVVIIYNNLVSLKNGIAKSWSHIDVLLKQRHDELPKLVAVCKKHMLYERDILEKIVQARRQIASAQQQKKLKELGDAESFLRLELGNLFALVENYPELKTDKTFHHLQNRISGLEEAVTDRREFYNENVHINNVQMEQFPDLFVARSLGFKSAEVLMFSEREKTDLDLQRQFE